MTHDLHSGDTSTFSYTVVEGDLDAGGVSIAANAISSGAGTIRDAALNDANESHGALSDDSAHGVDGVKPTISSLAFRSSPDSLSTYAQGEDIEIRVVFSEQVTSSGDTSLDVQFIHSGVMNTKELEAPATGPATSIDYSYRIARGDEASDGIALPANAVMLDGETIRDSAGNDAVLDSDAISLNASHRIDGRWPEVVSVTVVSTPNGQDSYYLKGAEIELLVLFDERIVVSLEAGDTRPSLTVNIGGTNRAATYSSATTSGMFFVYTVVGNDEDDNGISVPANGLSLGNGELGDLVGNNLDARHPVEVFVSHKVDGILPTLSSITFESTPTSGGAYTAGQQIDLDVHYSEPIRKDEGGQPSLALKLDSDPTDKTASYVSVTSSSVRFSYTVVAGDNDATGISTPSDPLSPGNGAHIVDIPGNPADNDYGGLSAHPGHRVDTTPPLISSLRMSSSPGGENGWYKRGDTLSVEVDFSEDVQQASAVLLLTLDAGVTTISKEAGSPSVSSDKITFDYTVGSGDYDADGPSVLAPTPFKTGTVVKDLPGNTGPLTITASQQLDDVSGHPIDGVDPTITNIAITSAAQANGLAIGDSFEITVTFSERVRVVSTDPTLPITIGGSSKSMSCKSSCGGSTTMVFTYTVANGDSGQIVAPARNLNQNVKDDAGNSATPSYTRSRGPAGWVYRRRRASQRSGDRWLHHCVGPRHRQHLYRG